MFDVSFPEMFICLLVALIVLGPEKLPKIARAVGRWTGQARAYMRNLSVELERETQVREIREQMEAAKRAMNEANQSLNEGARKIVDSDPKAP